MKKFFNLAALCLAPLFLAAIFSCSNNGDAPANLTQIIGTQQTDGQAAQTKFLTDWETMEFLYINDSGTLNKKIEAPWNKEAASTLMPESIRMDVKKEDGWEVAFNLMNKDGHPDMNYFGLYNKYTGVLRFFYYFNKEVSQSATDFAFEVILGTDGAKNPAYYAALKYGIPMDADVKTNVNLLGAGNTSKTFHLLITPYSGIGRNEMSQGWYAFDIDMSAYTGKSFFTDGSPIQIACRANNKTSVSLGTDILGKIGGDFNGTIDKAKLQASSNGTSALLSDISDGSSSVGKALSSTADALDKGGAAAVVAGIGAVFDWVACGLNIAAICKKDRSKPNPQPQDKMSGKLDLKLNATAKTQGYLETSVATNVRQFTLEKNAFNPDSNVGKGVWNIDKSPELYFIPETIFDNLEFAYFYDPTSFSVVINKELFPDASNIKVISYCGTYMNNQNAVRNIAFREAFGLGSLETPTFNIDALHDLADKVKNDTSRTRAFSSIKISDDLPSTYFIDTTTEGLLYRGYYFKLNDENPFFNFMLEPHLDLARSPSPTKYPELYVAVAVLFDSNGKTFFYSRTYLPKVSEISLDKAKEILAGIKERLAERTDMLYKDEYARIADEKLKILSQPIL